MVSSLLPTPIAASDGQLLEQYVSGHDAGAFTDLVARHGAMVFGVCERVLRHRSDAEDAFQATFLALVRRAAELDRSAPLSPWLYTVAYRTAVKCRRRRARRFAGEFLAARSRPAEIRPDTWDDLSPVLEEELNRLPDGYRDVLVLCYLEGKSHRQAAIDLGWRAGSVSHRVARARDMLRSRLLQRGVTLSAALLLFLLGRRAHAAVPSRLAAKVSKLALVCGSPTTVKAAAGVALGKKLIACALTTKLAVAAAVVPAVAGIAILKPVWWPATSPSASEPGIPAKIGSLVAWLEPTHSSD